jgi:hypothetical protein
MTTEEKEYLDRVVDNILAALPDDSERATLVLRRAMARRLCSVCPERVVRLLDSPAPLCVSLRPAAA